MTVDLKGRVALITGASRGIGAAVAKSFAAAGAQVVLVARTVGGLEEVDDAIRAAGGLPATLLPLDLMKVNEIEKLAPAIAGRFGKLDILVGNAAMLGTLGPMTHMKAKEWDKVQTLNVTVNFRLIKALEPLLLASDAGRMIFTSSGLAMKPLAYWSAYCTSKAALQMMIKTYAAETEKTKLRVNLVDPGLVDTAMLREAFPGGYPGETRTPEEAAKIFLELASPACRKHGEIS